jgi:hypothetical protein
MKNHQSARYIAGSMKYEEQYSVELARGSSHIASTRSSATLNAAVDEVLRAFVTLHGAADSPIFLELLAVRLEMRGFPVAAVIVRRVATVGVERAFEEASGSAETNPASRLRHESPTRRTKAASTRLT